MSIVEDLLKNKEEIFVKVLQFLGGEEATTKINLDGVKFDLGRFHVKLNGEVEVTVSQNPSKKKK